MKKFHPLADCLPMLAESEMIELADDIKKNGLNHPVMIFEGMILDGRNRYVACQRAGIPARFVEFEGDFEGATALVISENIVRRQMTEGQKAAASAELDRVFGDRLREEAKENLSIAGSKHTGNQYTEKMEPCQIIDTVPTRKFERNETRTTTRLAEMTGANRQYVSDAIKIRDTEPELFEQVKSGEKTIPQVKREIKKKEVIEKIKSMPSDKYRVIYADPPWSYNDKQSGTISENYGGAEKHYPSMSISEIKEMGISEISEIDSVLFLWATSPLLPEALEVVKAWGFKYKACFVWDKVGHNMGHYNSVRHEFLLIGTRGSCTPENVKLFDSVQSIEKTKKHSEKPEEFRTIIDTLYPSGKRIELFARKQTENWEVWGAES